MSNIAFDLEEKIMDCWNVTSEIKLVYSEYCDSAEIMTEDELANIMIGIEYLYERKFKRLMKSYEKICSHGVVFLDKEVVDNARLVDLDKPVDKQEWDSFFLTESEDKR